ncbi:MAG: RluA family pseudouridine synthase [Planctomycetota bacterium]
MERLQVLHEDNHLLVVNKPAGLATMGDPGRPTLHSLAADYLRRKYHKPGKVFLGIVSRLDRLTTGAIVLARTSKAARRLSAQFANPDGGAAKTYLAIVAGRPLTPAGTWVDRIYKDDRAHRMRVAEARQIDVESTQHAELDYRTLQEIQDGCVLEIALKTGRKHQIRVQAAQRGLPILGDQKYGSQDAWQQGIALHSHRLVIEHPTRKEPVDVVAPLPPYWPRVQLGAAQHE